MGNVRALAEAVATFDQLFQPLGEARCRSPVDDRVIETQRHAEIFADGYLPVNDAWLRSYATQGNIDGMVVDRDAPAAAFPEHPDCRYAHCPTVFLLHLRIHLTHPAEGPPADSDEHHRQEPEPVRGCETLPGFTHLLHLGCPDLVMNLAEGLLIGGSDDVDNGLLLASHLTLNRGRHIHFIKKDEVLAAFATRMQGCVLTNGVCQTGDDERCER